MPRIAITTLGCKINQFESAALHEQLKGDGYDLVPFDQDAEVYVVNTCTVTAKSDAESRKLIRRARRRNPASRIVVTGCYAQVAPDSIAAMPEVDLVVGNSEKKTLSDILADANSGRIMVGDIALKNDTTPLRLESHAEHTRAFLQIQNGCDAFCTYCIVPYARGRSRSVPCSEVIEAVRGFARKGFNEVVLTGIHLGAFGLDLNPSQTLLDLLKAVEAEAIIPNLRLGSLEPGEITDDLVSFLAGSRTVCPHLHIPLQSGDDNVLKRMGRSYTAEFFRERVTRIVQAIPDIFIGLDVIAGFPGESEDEFEHTRSLLQDLPIAALHVFPYSPRQGTPAASMPDQIPAAVSKKRVRTLLQLSEEKQSRFHEKFTGRDMDVLLLYRRRDGLMEGITRNYIPVSVAGAAGDTAGAKIPVNIEKAGAQRCHGRALTMEESADAVS